jgi:hypothetical protein
VRRLAPAVLVALVLLAAPARAASTCARIEPGREVGTVAADLTEISGVVASRTFPGVWWVHDDSGGRAELTAITESGQSLGTYALDGARAVDWEDIAVYGRDLYVGDIGDNLAAHDHVTVYRVPEPAARPSGSSGRLDGVATIALVYPTGPVNAESLLVDPVSGDLFVLTKEDGFSRVFRAPAASLVDGARITLEQVARFSLPEPASTAFGLPGSLVTGADVSPDGSTVLVRTYRSVLAFARPAGQPLAAAFASAPCEAPQVEEPQGEAVGIAADGRSYLTLSEGDHVPIHRFAVRTPVSTTTAAATEPARSSSIGPLVGLLVVVAALGVVVATRRRAGR